MIPTPLRFAVVASLATATDIALALGLVAAGWARLWADLVALAVAAAVSRTLHARVTLRGDSLERWIRRTPVFVTVALAAGFVDVVLFVTLGGVRPWIAKLVALSAAAVLRATAHRLVLFRAVRREQGRPAGRPLPTAGPRLSVVVPAYREADRIGETITRLRHELGSLEAAGDLEVVVVDDGSRDGTDDAARAAGADQVVVQSRNRGKGAAVRAGVAVATGRTIAFTDADLAYAPHQLLALLSEVEAGWDVVIGNRHHPDSEALVGASPVRSLGSRIVNLASHVMLLGNYRDTQCGCKAFRADVARPLFAAGRIDRFAFDIELLHLVERYGLSLDEVPVAVANSDTSTVRALRDGIGVGLDILRIRRHARRGHYPPLASGP